MKRMYIALYIIMIFALSCSAVYFCNKSDKLQKENEELNSKVEFYVKVMEDFDISEFAYYPELYYEDGYVDQVKVHNCMWAFDQYNYDE